MDIKTIFSLLHVSNEARILLTLNSIEAITAFLTNKEVPINTAIHRVFSPRSVSLLRPIKFPLLMMDGTHVKVYRLLTEHHLCTYSDKWDSQPLGTIKPLNFIKGIGRSFFKIDTNYDSNADELIAFSALSCSDTIEDFGLKCFNEYLPEECSTGAEAKSYLKGILDQNVEKAIEKLKLIRQDPENSYVPENKLNEEDADEVALTLERLKHIQISSETKHFTSKCKVQEKNRFHPQIFKLFDDADVVVGWAKEREWLTNVFGAIITFANDFNDYYIMELDNPEWVQTFRCDKKSKRMIITNLNVEEVTQIIIRNNPSVVVKMLKLHNKPYLEEIEYSYQCVEFN
jgi:hypothetical protein